MSGVAVLGTGKMGAGMARSLLRSGRRVIVWNRSRDKAESLAADGARVPDTPADTVSGVRSRTSTAPPTSTPRYWAAGSRPSRARGGGHWQPWCTPSTTDHHA
ncbi:MAG: NAD(P)-binding domain-containing protein [Pseudonocardiaceae bacterium]